MATKESQSIAEWTDDQLLDYWDDPKNRDAIINAVSLDDMTPVDIICDHYKGVDREYVTKVLNAVPKNFDPDFNIDESDMKKMQSLVMEKNIPELERYFCDYMKEDPSSIITATEDTNKKEHPSSDTNKKEHPSSDTESTGDEAEEEHPLPVATATGNEYEAALMEKLKTLQMPSNAASSSCGQAARQGVQSSIQYQFAYAINDPSVKSSRPLDSEFAEPSALLTIYPIKPVLPRDEQNRVLSHDKQKESPYKSVGKLYWHHPEHPEHTWATAFYVGKNRIVTVAHSIVKFLEQQPTCFLQKYLQLFYPYPRRSARKAVFIPAMINYQDTDGTLFGHYTISDVRVHSLFQPCRRDKQKESCYDICSARLGKGRHRNSLLNYFFDSIWPDPDAASRLTPLPLKPYQPLEPRMSRSYKVIGYSNRDSEKGMMEMGGAETNDTDIERNEEIPRIYIAQPLRTGISGGPWIRGGVVHGITLGGDLDQDGHPRAQSSNITPEILRNIGVE